MRRLYSVRPSRDLFVGTENRESSDPGPPSAKGTETHRLIVSGPLLLSTWADLPFVEIPTSFLDLGLGVKTVETVVGVLPLSFTRVTV